MTTAVRERPIIASAESVRAYLAGRKTQTRRVVNLARLKLRVRETVRSEMPLPKGEERPQCWPGLTYPAHIGAMGAVSAVLESGRKLGLKPDEFDFECPYATGETYLVTDSGGQQTWHVRPNPGDRLWVRETWAGGITRNPDSVDYRADGHDYGHDDAGRPLIRWRSPIRMPRWAARIVLEITDVRVQRVQEISEEDCFAEGVRDSDPKFVWIAGRARNRFRTMWNLDNEKRGYGWHANPWAWCITTKLVSPGTEP